jgi:hypothetical protein
MFEWSVVVCRTPSGGRGCGGPAVLHRNFLRALFIISLGLTLFYGEYLWVARAGWLFVALLMAAERSCNKNCVLFGKLMI